MNVCAMTTCGCGEHCPNVATYYVDMVCPDDGQTWTHPMCHMHAMQSTIGVLCAEHGRHLHVTCQVLGP